MQICSSVTLRLYTFSILKYKSPFGIRLTQVSSVLRFFETQPALPFFVRQNENRICQLAGAKFEMKAATYFEQTVNNYSNIATTTLQSSHENEYPV